MCQDPTGQTDLGLPERARGLSKVTQPGRHSSGARTSGTCFRGCLPSQDPGPRPQSGSEDLAGAAEMGGRADRAREGTWRSDNPGAGQRGYCGSRSSDARTTLGAPRGPRIPNSPAAAAESGRRRRTPCSAIPRCPGWGENTAAHFLSNPARRPTSLATASISITLLGSEADSAARGGTRCAVALPRFSACATTLTHLGPQAASAGPL